MKTLYFVVLGFLSVACISLVMLTKGAFFPVLGSPSNVPNQGQASSPLTQSSPLQSAASLQTTTPFQPAIPLQSIAPELPEEIRMQLDFILTNPRFDASQYQFPSEWPVVALDMTKYSLLNPQGEDIDNTPPPVVFVCVTCGTTGYPPLLTLPFGQLPPIYDTPAQTQQSQR